MPGQEVHAGGGAHEGLVERAEGSRADVHVERLHGVLGQGLVQGEEGQPDLADDPLAGVRLQLLVALLQAVKQAGRDEDTNGNELYIASACC